VVEAEGDKIEEWEFFWGLGRRMGLAMSLGNGPIAMDRKPTKFELLENITAGSRVPLARMRARSTFSRAARAGSRASLRALRGVPVADESRRCGVRGVRCAVGAGG
jgi:hypothetical protein